MGSAQSSTFTTELNFAGTIVPHRNPNYEEAAVKLKKAFGKTIGIHEEPIIEVFTTHSNKQIQEIVKIYKGCYGSDLMDKIEKVKRSDLRKGLKALCRTRKHHAAHKLRDAIKGAGTDETTLIEIICSQSNTGIIEIKEEYQKEFGRDLEKDVKGDTSGDFKKFMVAMLQGTREENKQLDQAAAERDADLLIKAGPKKWGTDEETFSMIFARRSFVQLRAIVLAFEEKTGKLMEKMIESETRKELCSAYKTVVKLAKNPGNYFASRIHKGMKGAGTDEDTVIWNLVFTSEICLENVKTEFEKLTKQSLEKAIKSEFRGDAEKLLLAVCKGNRS